jgi:hypothetical protein
MPGATGDRSRSGCNGPRDVPARSGLAKRETQKLTDACLEIMPAAIPQSGIAVRPVCWPSAAVANLS